MICAHDVGLYEKPKGVQVQVMNSEHIEQRLREHFPHAKIKLGDMTGGGDHWQLWIEAEEFRELSMVEQHQAVYKALGDWMKKEIHALSLQTRIP